LAEIAASLDGAAQEGLPSEAPSLPAGPASPPRPRATGHSGHWSTRPRPGGRSPCWSAQATSSSAWRRRDPLAAGGRDARRDAASDGL